MPAGSTLVRIDRSGGSRPKSNAHTFSIIYIKQKKTPAKKTSALFFSDIHPLHTAIRMCRGDRTTSSSPSTPHSPSSSSSPSSYTPTTKMKRDLTPNTDTDTDTANTDTAGPPCDPSQMEQVISWVHDDRRTVTAKSICVGLCLPRGASSRLLSDLLSHHHSHSSHSSSRSFRYEIHAMRLKRDSRTGRTGASLARSRVRACVCDLRWRRQR